MTPAETATILRQLHDWLKGGTQWAPTRGAEAVEAAVEMIERDEFKRECFGHISDNSLLRAKVEAMEKQEPVASVWRCDNGHIHGSCERTLPMGTKLYALPGAQTQGEEE